MRYFFILFTLLFLFSSSAYTAKTIQYGVIGGFSYFSGKKTESLAPNSGYLGRFEAGVGSGFFRFNSNFTLAFAQASSTFTDNSAQNEYSFRLISGEFNFGIKCYFLYFLPKSPIQPYAGGSGAIHITSLKFTESDSMSETWPRTDARIFYGYAIYAGVDILFTKKFGINFHFEDSLLMGKIANASFKLSSLRYMFGIVKRIE